MISRPFINGGVGDQGIGNQVGYAGVDGLIRPIFTINSSKKTVHLSGIYGSLGLFIIKFHKRQFEIVCRWI